MLADQLPSTYLNQFAQIIITYTAAQPSFSIYFTSSAVLPGSLGLHLIVLSNVCCLCPHCGVDWFAQEGCV